MSRFTPLFDSICTSARMADLPDDTCRVFYVWLLAKCDAWGRHDARPRKLNVSVWPLLGKSDAETARALEVLRSAGLVEVYWPEGQDPFLQVPDWEEKAGTIGRKSHRRPSQHPDPESVANCKVPGEPGASGRSRADRALPGEAGHASSPLLSVKALLGGEIQEGGRAADPVPSESPPTDSPRRRPSAATWESALAADEFAPLRADPGWMEAWSAWIEHAGSPGVKARAPKAPRAKQIFRDALRVGPAMHVAAIRASIRNDWQGVDPSWIKPGSLDFEEAKASAGAAKDRAARIADAKARAEQIAADIPLMESGSPEGMRLIGQWRKHGQTDAEVIASLKEQIERARRA